MEEPKLKEVTYYGKSEKKPKKFHPLKEYNEVLFKPKKNPSIKY